MTSTRGSLLVQRLEREAFETASAASASDTVATSAAATFAAASASEVTSRAPNDDMQAQVSYLGRQVNRLELEARHHCACGNSVYPRSFYRRSADDEGSPPPCRASCVEDASVGSRSTGGSWGVSRAAHYLGLDEEAAGGHR
jgi:hypothetical protein